MNGLSALIAGGDSHAWGSSPRREPSRRGLLSPDPFCDERGWRRPRGEARGRLRASQVDVSGSPGVHGVSFLTGLERVRATLILSVEKYVATKVEGEPRRAQEKEI